MTTLIVHIEKGIADHGGDYDRATRFAWHLSAIEASTVSSAVGLVNGQIVFVISGCYAQRVPAGQHMAGRFELVGGQAWHHKNDIFKQHPIMYKKLRHCQKHRYAASLESVLNEWAEQI